MQETLKEGARIVILAAVSALLSFLLGKVVPDMPQTQTTAILTLVLKMADKWIHSNQDLTANGLLPF